MDVKGHSRIALATIALAFAGAAAAFAAAPGNPKPVKEVGGLWFDKDGAPTYNITKDGTVDWGTFVGYLRYNSICLDCHGPDGSGSSYAPDLTQALQQLSYSQFIADVAGGIKSVNTAQDLVMPSFATNKNVMCFIGEIYSYLRARSTGALGRGRPAKSAPDPKGFDEASYKCLGIPM
ncbi:MAG TPA: c-type cytochrome, methanol metabolism-related [Acetobacteraceae bacterium]|nr:c-type cytochrome, methanol metabolism-related [Acetobacteraceae bacterium]